MSIVRKGRKQSEEWINKRIAKAGTEMAKKYGKPKTEEEKKHLSENAAKYWLNKTRSDETKQKISQTKKGSIPPNRKQVYKVEVSSNTLLGVYNSTSEAAQHNPEFSQSSISRICNNKMKSKEKFIFTYDYPK